MSNLVYDAIIVGQGLAGTILYHTLNKYGLNSLVIDNNHLSSASLAAAGIYNPVIIKRLRESWRGLEFIEFAESFYESIEQRHSWKIKHEIAINRIFSSEKEYHVWEDKMLESKWDKRIKTSSKSIQGEQQEVGIVQHTGWLNIPEFLGKSRQLLIERKLFKEEQFDFDLLVQSDDHIQYRGIDSKRIFFCEGYKINENPFFSYLPMSPVKGEILVIEDPGVQLNEILHCGHFILPIGDNRYKVGATFAWDELNEQPTQKAKDELIEGIRKYTSRQLKVIEHKAGVRPAVRDRRPLIGTHKKYENIHVFNGMGTRGVMLAPFFANNLIAHLQEDEPLELEADIKRFN